MSSVSTINSWIQKSTSYGKRARPQRVRKNIGPRVNFGAVFVLTAVRFASKAHRVVRILEVGILGQKWNHGILFLPNF